MSLNLTQKILKSHLVSGKLVAGEEIAIRIDQTLTQDATGTMAYLQFEALGIPRVKTKLSVSYIDHNTLQSGFENADDHRYLQSVAAKYGIYFSKPGNGICHQVNVERFGVPGRTLLGSDSHTPTGGGIGMIAIGAGGLDVAVAMGGGPFYLATPKVVLVELKGKLRPGVSAKDIILEVLRRVSVKGGVGKIFEYGGPGVKTLTVPERSTITNMGAELGATTSIFPSDATTKAFLKAQGRTKDWKELKADRGCDYDEVITIDLNKLEALIAQPHSPDNVCRVKDIEGKPVQQVIIGSCTNSSYKDLMTVAGLLKGKKVSPDISFAVAPGSKQVFEMISRNGALADIVAAGARILESACGACIGMGQSPCSGGITVRTFNRNFLGRSGTKDGQVYLASPEVAVATALKGKMADPRKLGKYPKVAMPSKFIVNDNLLVKPPRNGSKVKVLRGPNIAPLPSNKPLPNTLSGKVLLKVGDNITTDHIMPAGSKILPLRSNIPKISEHVFEVVDPNFSDRAKKNKGGFIIGGGNYGQGSSREHAALAPMYLGVKFVLTKSFARIHRANLVNFGILPLTFSRNADYGAFKEGDALKIENVHKALKNNEPLKVKNLRTKKVLEATYDLTDRQKAIILAGGLLNYTKKNVKK